MFFLNLSLGEFLALLGALGGLITALYFLDRARRRRVVSSLRFWLPEGATEAQRSRRRVRDPWSLILQLLSLLCLLLALAQLQWGTHARRGEDHVLLIDTSSWSRSHLAGQPLLDREKGMARDYLSRLSPGDRVMLVAAGGLATPLTPFTADHAQLLSALAELSSEYSALDLAAVLRFAHQAQTLGQSGEIIYVGPHLVNNELAGSTVSNLRILSVSADRENCGIRQLTVKQAADSEDSWQALIRIRNYGLTPQRLRLQVAYKGTAFSPRSLTLLPGAEESADFTFTTRVAGSLTASITPGGSLAEDDRVSINLPQPGAVKVAVYTARRRLLQPLLAANHELHASFFSPEQYQPKPDAALLLLDGFDPAQPPQVPSLWIDPPAGNSPLPVTGTVKEAVVRGANAPAGLPFVFPQLRVPSAATFQLFQDDQPLAAAEEGPVIVLRPGGTLAPRLAVVGFDPLAGELRYEVATPLLFAHLLRWLSPDTFRSQDFMAERVGTAEVKLESAETPDRLQVTDARGFALPFTVRDNILRLFVSRPTAVRISSPQHRRLLSLVIPDVAEHAWKIPAAVRSGLPSALPFASPSIDLWKWLALLGGAGLLSEWILFGRQRSRLKRSAPSVRSVPAAEREREMVAK